ncbi:hypothetical protein CBR_g78901 [Chara braunii]|uniref:Uncharacterized protein n=1 Tax=Chara braunii TaxID=69332 RepID=A0A388JKS0_CHABU|nr:hypothetical protein CBR_g78901 [Chara braunii]|eukprot:GBG45424.1 hypothetical protein CBR_g78901 [Chara braunii]
MGIEDMEYEGEEKENELGGNQLSQMTWRFACKLPSFVTRELSEMGVKRRWRSVEAMRLTRGRGEGERGKRRGRRTVREGCKRIKATARGEQVDDEDGDDEEDEDEDDEEEDGDEDDDDDDDDDDGEEETEAQLGGGEGTWEEGKELAWEDKEERK